MAILFRIVAQTVVATAMWYTKTDYSYNTI